MKSFLMYIACEGEYGTILCTIHIQNKIHKYPSPKWSLESKKHQATTYRLQQNIVYNIYIDKSQRGSEIQLLNNIDEENGKISKPQQALKNSKYKINSVLFQFFNHIDQQQHQINTLAHKYRKDMDIYDVVANKN